MTQPILVEGLAALDIVIAKYAPKLAETWPGDAALVGLLIQVAGTTEKTGVVWAPPERVLGDLTQRRNREQDPRRRAPFENAIEALTGPRPAGKVSLVVSGWGGLPCVELEADDLRTGKLVTTWRGGSA